MKTGLQQSSEARLTYLDFIPKMAGGTNRVRELGPLKSDGGMEARKVGRCSRFPCQERGGLFLLCCVRSLPLVPCL